MMDREELYYKFMDVEDQEDMDKIIDTVLEVAAELAHSWPHYQIHTAHNTMHKVDQGTEIATAIREMITPDFKGGEKTNED